MAEQLDNHEAPEQTPRQLLEGARYWLGYYIDQDTDLSPLNAVQELIERALAQMPESVESDRLNQEFEISVVTRQDVASCIPEKVAMTFSDAEMKYIARAMGDMHNDNGSYWQDLDYAIKLVLTARGGEDQLNVQGIPLKDFRGEDGKFISNAEGYPVIYIDSEGSIHCAECASATDPVLDYPIVAGHIFYEGEQETCASCDKVLESAYGNPYETGEDLDKEGDRGDTDLPDPYEA
jgi:hypothetical protein